MKVRILPAFLLLIQLLAGNASADPQITSWITTNSGRYARTYTSDANRNAGVAVTTWAQGTVNQPAPAYCGVQEIAYSANWVYIRATGLGSHVMGPWYLNVALTQVFPNFPKNTKALYRMPRTSTLPTPPRRRRNLVARRATLRPGAATRMTVLNQPRSLDSTPCRPGRRLEFASAALRTSKEEATVAALAKATSGDRE